MSVVRFPTRYRAAVFIIREPLGGFYVLVRSYGWLFGSFSEAHGEALSLAAALGWPVRVEGSP